MTPGQSDTGVWICPMCGYVDPDTTDVACGGQPGAPPHTNALFVQAVKGERLPGPEHPPRRFALVAPLEGALG